VLIKIRNEKFFLTGKTSYGRGGVWRRINKVRNKK